MKLIIADDYDNDNDYNDHKVRKEQQIFTFPVSVDF